MSDFRPLSSGQPRALLNTRQVAARLGRTLNWFYRNKKRLENEHEFPHPVGGCGGRWDPAAIDAWLDRQMPARLREPVDPSVPSGFATWEDWMLGQARKPHEGEAA